MTREWIRGAAGASVIGPSRGRRPARIELSVTVYDRCRFGAAITLEHLNGRARDAERNAQWRDSMWALILRPDSGSTKG